MVSKSCVLLLALSWTLQHSYAQNAAGETSSDNILSTFTYSDCLNTSINGQVDYGAGSLDSSIDCTVPRKSFLSLNTTTGLGAGCVGRSATRRCRITGMLIPGNSVGVFGPRLHSERDHRDSWNLRRSRQ